MVEAKHCTVHWNGTWPAVSDSASSYFPLNFQWNHITKEKLTTKLTLKLETTVTRIWRSHEVELRKIYPSFTPKTGRCFVSLSLIAWDTRSTQWGRWAISTVLPRSCPQTRLSNSPPSIFIQKATARWRKECRNGSW